MPFCIGTGVSDDRLGTNTEQYCIEKYVVMNHVIKRLRCISFTQIYFFRIKHAMIQLSITA